MVEYFFLGFILAVAPGPDFVLILRHTLLHGRQIGYATFAGNRVSFCVHLLLAFFGLAVVLKTSQSLFFLVRILGAGYLFYLGVRSFIAYIRHVQPKQPKISPGMISFSQAFKEGFLTNLLNPQVPLFFLSFFPQIVTPVTLTESPGVIALSFFIGNSSWWIPLIALLGLNNIRNVVLRFQRIADIVFGIIFIGFGLRIVFELCF